MASQPIVRAEGSSLDDVGVEEEPDEQGTDERGVSDERYQPSEVALLTHGKASGKQAEGRNVCT